MKLMLTVLVLAMVTLSVTADCGVLERLVVQRQWSAAACGDDRYDFALDWSRDFFGTFPEARVFFDRVNGDNEFSPAFMAHAHRVMGGLDMCISLLHDVPTLNAQLAHLKGQHEGRGIAKDFYLKLKGSFFKILADRLRHKFNKPAWSSCYDLMIVSGIGG